MSKFLAHRARQPRKLDLLGKLARVPWPSTSGNIEEDIDRTRAVKL